MWHASPADIAGLREQIDAMARAVGVGDPVAFVHANWHLHARIAAVSPNVLLKSIYKNVPGAVDEP
ncbi:FCD domain-containing protein [Streptomyces sp. NPDC017988]|uniref:FCD domain-containing protein n=1 Tax=Streptomyces sp. NPDC017988 TaxID=3365025 RepID=UPI00379ECD48